MKNKFYPVFKESDSEQFYFENGVWHKCTESKIDSLWQSWVLSKNTHRFKDEDGCIVYGNLNKDEEE